MAKKFEIQKQGFPSVADAYNGLLGMDNNRVVNLPVSQLDEICRKQDEEEERSWQKKNNNQTDETNNQEVKNSESLG